MDGMVMIVKSVMVVAPNLKKYVRPVKVLNPIAQSHLVVTETIVAVSPVFRAVFASAMGISTMLAITALGGVLRSTLDRMLGIGDCTATIPL